MPTHHVASVIVRLTTVISFALMTLLACTAVDQRSGDTQAYRSIWFELYPQTLQREPTQDTLLGAFHFAAAAESQAVAEERWMAFLSNWAPAHGEFEDAMHARLVTWAELEMHRLRYLMRRMQSEASTVRSELLELAAELE